MKNFKLFFSGTLEKNQICFAHDTIKSLNYVVQDLNIKIKGTWTEIIDIKILSSLK